MSRVDFFGDRLCALGSLMILGFFIYQIVFR